MPKGYEVREGQDRVKGKKLLREQGLRGVEKLNKTAGLKLRGLDLVGEALRGVVCGARSFDR